MTKTGKLQRLSRLYKTLERMQEMKVEAAARSLAEIESGIERSAAEEIVATRTARQALSKGSRVESLALERVAPAAAAYRASLTELQAARAAEHALAAQALLHSRTATRQIETMWKRVTSAEKSLAERRDQASADDRFIDRRGRGPAEQ